MTDSYIVTYTAAAVALLFNITIAFIVGMALSYLLRRLQGSKKIVRNIRTERPSQ